MPRPQPTLLLVEDDFQLRFLLTAVLSRSGYTVRSAHDGFQALDEIRNEIPDIILSDLYMAGMSGFELLSVVRRRFPAVHVVAMSSAYSGDSVPDGIAADAFYAKTGNPAALLRIVAAVQASNPNLPTRANSALVPIWVARDEADGLKVRFVLLTCPDCLRTFPQIAGNKACIVHTAGCIFCSTQIRYAFV